MRRVVQVCAVGLLLSFSGFAYGYIQMVQELLNARNALASGDLESAEDILLNFLEGSNRANFGEALYLLGDTRLALGERDSAIEAFNGALNDAGPWALPAADVLAGLLMEQADWERVVEVRIRQFELLISQRGAAVDSPQVEENLEALVKAAMKSWGKEDEQKVKIDLARAHEGTRLAAALLFRLEPERSPDGNLVRNPGFELDGQVIGPPPLGWEFMGAGEFPLDDLDGTLSESYPGRNFGRVRSGSFCVGKYTEYGTHRSWLYQKIPVEPGTRYECTVFGHTPAQGEPGTLRLGVDLLGGTDPEAPSVNWTERVSPKEEYEEFGFKGPRAIRAESNILTLFLELHQSTIQAPNSMLFDDAKVMKSNP